jgi:PAS domain S-box-containing protein
MAKPMRSLQIGAGQAGRTTAFPADPVDRKRLVSELGSGHDDLLDFVENAPFALHLAAQDGTIIWANAAELDLLGYVAEEYVGRNIAEFHVLRGTAHEILRRLSNREELRNFETRVRCRDGAIKHVAINCNVMWRDGRFAHSRCFTRDITSRVAADLALRTALAEKEILLREIHHRVKNNLQLISSLFSLQMLAEESERVRERLSVAQTRVRALGIVHNLLYETENYVEIDLAQLIATICEKFVDALDPVSGRVRHRIAVAPLRTNMDRAIPLTLLICEALTNALKHAFPDGRPGTIDVSLDDNGGESLLLRVSDDGVGFDPAVGSAEDGKTLGLKLITTLASQLGGTAEFGGSCGAEIRVKFRRHQLCG